MRAEPVWPGGRVNARGVRAGGRVGLGVVLALAALIPSVGPVSALGSPRAAGTYALIVPGSDYEPVSGYHTNALTGDFWPKGTVTLTIASTFAHADAFILWCDGGGFDVNFPLTGGTLDPRPHTDCRILANEASHYDPTETGAGSYTISECTDVSSGLCGGGSTPTDSPVPIFGDGLGPGQNAGYCGDGVDTGSADLPHCAWAGTGATEADLPHTALALDFNMAAGSIDRYGNWRLALFRAVTQDAYIRSSFRFKMTDATKSFTAEWTFDPEPDNGSSPPLSPTSAQTGGEVFIEWFDKSGAPLPVTRVVGGVSGTYQADFGTVYAHQCMSGCGPDTWEGIFDRPPLADTYRIGVICAAILGDVCPNSTTTRTWFAEIMDVEAKDVYQHPTAVACDPTTYGCVDPTKDGVPTTTHIDPNTGRLVCGPLSHECDKPFVAPLPLTVCVPGSDVLDIVGWLSDIACLLTNIPTWLYNNVYVPLTNALIDLLIPGFAAGQGLNYIEADARGRIPFIWISTTQAYAAGLTSGGDSAATSHVTGTIAGHSVNASMDVFGQFGSSLTSVRPYMGAVIALIFAFFLVKVIMSFFRVGWPESGGEE